jgi:polar amino acid transport system permease protein
MTGTLRALASLLSSPSRPSARPKRVGPARIVDCVIVVAVAGSAVWLIFEANHRLSYHWDWAVIPTFLIRHDTGSRGWAPNILLLGLFTTIRLATLSLLLGSAVGAVLASMLVYGRPALRWTARGFVELVRDTPPIVLIFVMYFFVSSQIIPVFGLDRVVTGAPQSVQVISLVVLGRPDRINDFLSGLVCLSFLSGAYITEIFRAGLQSVPKSQIEGGRALGLRGWQILRFVVFPQAVQNILPALAGQFIVSIKDSSLVSLISVQELTFMTSEVSSTTQRFFEVWLFTAAVYFCICFSCSLTFRRLEQRRMRWA